MENDGKSIRKKLCKLVCPDRSNYINQDVKYMCAFEFTKLVNEIIMLKKRYLIRFKAYFASRRSNLGQYSVYLFFCIDQNSYK